MPNQNAKAMRKQANWLEKGAPKKAAKDMEKNPFPKKHHDSKSKKVELSVYARSKAEYERWAKKRHNESVIEHKCRIALKDADPLLKDLFITRYEKRLTAMKQVDLLKRLKRVCGSGIEVPHGIGDRMWHFINIHNAHNVHNAVHDYYIDGFFDKPYKPYLKYYEKNPSNLTDCELEQTLTIEVHSSLRMVYHSFPHDVRRTLDRVLKIKDELDVEWRRRSCMAACRAYKEDLMAATWHPRRVQKILDIGGFELLDHLIPG